MIGAIVVGKLEFLPIKGKLSIGNPVGIPTGDASKYGLFQHSPVIGQIQRDIFFFPVSVSYNDISDRCPILNYTDLHTMFIDQAKLMNF